MRSDQPVRGEFRGHSMRIMHAVLLSRLRCLLSCLAVWPTRPGEAVNKRAFHAGRAAECAMERLRRLRKQASLDFLRSFAHTTTGQAPPHSKVIDWMDPGHPPSFSPACQLPRTQDFSTAYSSVARGTPPP
jgi:hypothetical protein